MNYVINEEDEEKKEEEEEKKEINNLRIRLNKLKSKKYF